jgi:hypothetical protein
MILLFELFQPTGTVRLEMAVRVTYGRCKEPSLFSNNGVTERQALPLVVSRPICKRTFDVGEFSLRPFNG